MKQPMQYVYIWCVLASLDQTVDKRTEHGDYCCIFEDFY